MGTARLVGGGVIGMTTALLLAEDGWDVELTTREPPAATTSAVAAAVWYPYLVGPEDAVRRWGAATAERLAALAADPAVPVAARTLHELFRTPDVDPAWRPTMPDASRATTLPDWAADGWSFTSWTADMPRYLAWLRTLLEDAGVRVVERELDSLAGLADDADLVVDCAGLGARELAGDDALHPVAGQVVVVRGVEVRDVWLDPDGPEGATYVIPRTDTVVCGGTADADVWDRTPVAATTTSILRRATALVPSLAAAEVVDVRVGLRPSRPEVRLELVEDEPVPVLHHYGHGGAGVTLSWGAAADAVALARPLR